MRRRLFIFTLLLAVGATGVWLWIPSAQTPQKKLTPVASDSALAALAAPAARTVGAPEEPPRAAAPARMLSSVQPGMPVAQPAPLPPARPVSPADIRGKAAPPGPHSEALEDLQNAQLMLRDFRTRMGENPVGSNAEIMQAVMGANPAQARLGPPAGQNINAQGELVDRWGTPYFFHQLSGNQMEIRSAGPDQVLWSADDVVAR